MDLFMSILLVIFMCGLYISAYARSTPSMHIRVFEWMGKRIQKIHPEGINILEFTRPFSKSNTYSIERTTETISVDKVFTPEDDAEIVVVFEVTTKIGYISEVELRRLSRPDEKNNIPDDQEKELLSSLLPSSKEDLEEKNVESVFDFMETKNPSAQLQGIIAEQIRSFASDPYEKPKNWNDARGMSDKMARIIIAKILGYDIPRYTPHMLKDAAKKTPGEEGYISPEEAKEIVLGSHVSEEHMTAQEKKNKEKVVALFKNLKNGSGVMPVPGLGLIITRFNIKSVEPSDKLSKSLEKVASEQKEQVSEEIEGQTIAKVLKKFALELHLPQNYDTLSESEKEKASKKAWKIAEERYFSNSEDTLSLMRKFQYERGKLPGKSQEFVISLDSGSRDILSLLKKFLDKGGE